MIYAVGNGLADVDDNTGNCRQLLADVFEDGGLSSPDAFEFDLDFRGVHALGVVVHLGAAGSAARQFNFRNLHDELFRDCADAIRFRRRRARYRKDVDSCAAFVEGRQKLLAEAGHQDGGANKASQCQPEHKPAQLHGTRKRGPLAGL